MIKINQNFCHKKNTRKRNNFLWSNTVVIIDNDAACPLIEG